MKNPPSKKEGPAQAKANTRKSCKVTQASVRHTKQTLANDKSTPYQYEQLFEWFCLASRSYAAHDIINKNPLSENEDPRKQMQKASAADNDQGPLKPIELMGHM